MNSCVYFNSSDNKSAPHVPYKTTPNITIGAIVGYGTLQQYCEPHPGYEHTSNAIVNT